MKAAEVVLRIGFHMASLCEERALLDLVSGLKTLGGGFAVALRLAAHHGSGPML